MNKATEKDPFRTSKSTETPKEGVRQKVQQDQGGLFATFGGQLVDPLVVKDSFLRGSPIVPQKVAKKRP